MTFGWGAAGGIPRRIGDHRHRARAPCLKAPPRSRRPRGAVRPVGSLHGNRTTSEWWRSSYQKLLAQFGMRLSMSRKGNCYDNVPMESFWGSLTNEWVHHHRDTSRDQAIASIRAFIDVFSTANGVIQALAIWSPLYLLISSANSGRPLEGRGSTIARTPHPLGSNQGGHE